MAENYGYDKTGVSLSILCLIHCLAGPLIIAFFPMLEVFPRESIFHGFLGPILLVIAAIAFYRGYHRHKKLWVLFLGMLSFVFLAAGLLAPHDQIAFGRLTTQAFITSIGSVCLIAAHLFNIRYCRCSK